jgi:hypothetical protein
VPTLTGFEDVVMKLMQGIMVIVIAAMLNALFNPYPLAQEGRAVMALCRQIWIRICYFPHW